MLGKYKTKLGQLKPLPNNEVNRIGRWLIENKSKISISEIELKHRGQFGAAYVIVVCWSLRGSHTYEVFTSTYSMWKWIYRMHRNYPSTSRYSSHR